MKILLVNSLYPDLGIGGSEKSTYYLSQGLAELGHKVTVFSQNIEDRTIVERKDGIDVIRAATKPGTGPNIFSEPHYQRLAAASEKAYPLDNQLDDVLKKLRPDIVNTSVIGRLSLLWKRIKERNIACVHTLRSYNLLCHRRMIIGDRPCLRQCRDCNLVRSTARDRSQVVDGVIGIGSHVLDTHLRSGWFREAPEKTVIPNSYASDGGGSMPRADDDFRTYEFGYIGRLHHTKGVEIFLEALQELRKSTGRPHRTLIAGTGDAQFEWMLRQKFEDNDTQFIGYVSPEDFFSRVKYTVAPSIWYEPFGRVFMESLYYGVPVVGSLRGGGSEIIQDGETGWLFDPVLPSTRDALARASSASDVEYRRMTTAALARSENYSVLSIARSYESIYEKILRNTK